MEKILCVSLGCDKNLVDTENMLGVLKTKGYEFTDDNDEADIVIINTCCFIHDAKEESINSIIEYGQLKENGKLKGLIVTGCLAQRYKDEIEKELPEVDALIGISSIDKIVEAVDACIEKHNSSKCDENHVVYSSYEDISNPIDTFENRVSTLGGYTSYLKIAEGCDKNCTYCIIPKIRGKFRSIEMEHLLKEAKRLVENGTKELILVAQETTLYGVDLYGEKSLHKLLHELGKIEGLVWIRLLYAYPEEIYDELIDEMATNKKLCHYIDMPIQHASDNVLKRMGRRTSNTDLVNIITKLRERIPDIVIRTTLISGFPGETDEDHKVLYNFVDEMEFDRLGVFTYSMEEDTPAALLPDQIDEEVKEDRRDEIMELQQEIVFEKNENLIGKEVLVLIEGHIPNENAYIGRTYMDAPSVDGNIFITTDENLMSGDFVRAKITGSYEYDLIGEII